MGKPFNNGLTLSQAERLAILLEEMGEAQQAIGKILRHGYESYNPTKADGDSNRQQLCSELGDVEYAIDLLTSAGDLDAASIAQYAIVKAEKIKPYLHHQG